jgi:hypothetical protein
MLLFVVAALITSLDGSIEGPNGELDWVDSPEGRIVRVH